MTEIVIPCKSIQKNGIIKKKKKKTFTNRHIIFKESFQTISHHFHLFNFLTRHSDSH